MRRQSSGTQQPRCLWKGRIENIGSETAEDSNSYEAIYDKFSHQPTPLSWFQLAANSLVVAQEVALGCYLLARHRMLLLEESGNMQLKDRISLEQSTVAICIALGLVLVGSFAARDVPQQDRRTKAKQRLSDGLLLAILLRFLASLLRTLTGSYSSDTVQALAWLGIVLHVVACDYDYANGVCFPGSTAADTTTAPKTLLLANNRVAFRGGTFSLNAALFTTTLLISRLRSNLSGYVLVCLSIVAFAFYPDTRYAIACGFPPTRSVLPWAITGSVCVATYFLLDRSECSIFFAMIGMVVGVFPWWKYVAQKHKVVLLGPWEIPSLASLKLNEIS